MAASSCATRASMQPTPLRVSSMKPMKPLRSITPLQAQSGSFIIEAMISLLLFAVGLIGLMALSAQALNQVGQSKARNDASYIAGDLIAEMWVSDTVNIDAWLTRLDAVVPGAAATSNVYLASCDCVDTTGPDVCAGPDTGNVAIPRPGSQAVTICIQWTDRKDPTNLRRYSTSSLISKN
jgi:type IV pilus assembly protein PilV